MNNRKAFFGDNDMLNEDKIKLMVELSLYEKKQKKSVFTAERYFRNDFISKYLLLGFFKYSVSFVLLLFLHIMFQLDELMNIIRINDAALYILNIVFAYGIGLLLFEIITYFVWSMKYDKSKKVQDEYLYKLRALKKRYDFQSKSKEISKEDVGNGDSIGF